MPLSMNVFIPLTVCVAGLIYLAAQFPGRYWAYQVCANAWGLCENAHWLPVVIGSALIVGFLTEREGRRKGRN
jgi:hypothetical protein